MIVTGWHEAAFLLKTVKPMFYLGYVLLRYVLIYNLEVSFHFHLTFLLLNVIKMFTVQLKLFSTLLSAIFFVLEPFFDFPWRFELSGVNCITKDRKDFLRFTCKGTRMFACLFEVWVQDIRLSVHWFCFPLSAKSSRKVFRYRDVDHRSDIEFMPPRLL